MEDAAKLVADLEAEESVLGQEIAEMERALQRPTLDELRQQQKEVSDKLRAAREAAEEERRRRQAEVKASYESNLATAEAARIEIVKAWRAGCLALGVLGETAQLLAHDRVALRQFGGSSDLEIRDRNVFSPLPCRAEFAEDLEFVDGSFAPEQWPVMYPARKRF